jgi:hypothetical protein
VPFRANCASHPGIIALGGPRIGISAVVNLATNTPNFIFSFSVNKP